MNQHCNQDWIDDLFARAVELPADQRCVFLSDVRKDDANLLAEVQKLLVAHDRAEAATDFLAPPPADKRLLPPDSNRDDPLIGQRIGQYEVKRRLGGGGFGHVYLAFRSDDYKQKVAIKVLRSDIEVNDRVLARFELERQLLADLQHDHIARLLYGGTLETGRPYIVMEYVKGTPITEYCDEKRLAVSQRLALFGQVCEAVAYAHRFGAIHRDIKPGNIFVTEEGNAKLLDFGIAKMVDPLSQRRMVTISEGGMPLTPEYASPEQVRGEGISTASDVYSLGVVLYELLTGRRPYEFRHYSAAECERIICHEEPRKPSTVVLEPLRVRGDDDTEERCPAETIAAPRSADVQTLHRLLKGDLEQIVLKALRKEPNDRYPTVEALAADLNRYEQGQPVVARPISRSARALRWVKRNRAVTTLAAAAIVALVGGTIVSSYFAIDARNQAAAAIARENETRTVLDFVENRVFAAARPEGQEGGLGHDVTLRQAIEAALPFVERSFTKQPLIDARLRMTLGKSFDCLGQAEIAAQQFEIARSRWSHEVGPDHPDTLAAMNNLANAYGDAGRLDEALQLHEQTLAARRKTLGSDHPDTLGSMNNLATAYGDLGRLDEALRLHEQTLDAQRKMLGADHPSTLASMDNLARAYQDAGQLDESLTLYKQTLAATRKKLGADHPDTLGLMNNLATFYRAAGRLDEALSLYEQALAAMRTTLGEDHPDTLNSMNGLASAYYAVGRLDEALPLYEKALAAMRKKRGEDHPNTLEMMNNLASAFCAAGRLDEAIPLYEQTFAAMRKKLGADHPHTLSSMSGLATAYSAAGRLEEAIPLHEQTLGVQRKKRGADHPDTLVSMLGLASAFRAAGRLDKAISLYEQTLTAMRKKKLDADHPDTLVAMNNLAAAYGDAGRLDEAIPLYEQALTTMRKKLGTDHPHTLASMNNLAAAYGNSGRLDEAIPLYEQTLTAMRKRLGGDHPDLLESMNSLATALNEIAWNLATSSTDKMRDGKRAVQLASKACDLSQYKQPNLIDTLAAAYAETGDFESAVKWSERSLELLGDDGSPEQREQFSQALANYKASKPMRQRATDADRAESNDKQQESAESVKEQPDD